jgi:hypothetical protein
MKKENIEFLIKEPDQVETPENETKRWSQESLGFLLGDLEILKKTESAKINPEEYQRKSIEVFNELDQFFKDNGAEYHENVTDIYNDYSNGEPLVVRRENPSRLLELVNGGEIEMTFDSEVVGERGDKYANAALWPHGPVDKTSGIANAFLEGRGSAGPVVLLAGYKKNGDHMKIEEPEDKMYSVGTIDRHSVKILSGKLQNEDLAFVIMRAPVRYFDKNNLNEGEKNSTQVFRGYKFQ